MTKFCVGKFEVFSHNCGALEATAYVIDEDHYIGGHHIVENRNDIIYADMSIEQDIALRHNTAFMAIQDAANDAMKTNVIDQNTYDQIIEKAREELDIPTPVEVGIPAPAVFSTETVEAHRE